MERLDLGVGIVVFPDLLSILDDIDGLVDLYEVEPQTYWLAGLSPSAPWRPDWHAYGEIVGRGLPVLAHGVSAPVGSAYLPDANTVDLFAACVDALGAVGASEHLSFNQTVIDGHQVEASLFLPPCPNQTGVDRAVSAINEYQKRLDVPFSIETGVNYLQPCAGELPDSVFTARVAIGADCGILLDLHNLWCNQINGRERVEDALDRLPLERVSEVHLAGGMELATHYLDAHSGLTPPALLELTEAVLPRLANVRAVVFEIMPTFLWRVGLDPLRDHLTELQRLVDRSRRIKPSPAGAGATISDFPSDTSTVNALTVDALDVDPREWEQSLVVAATGWGAEDSEDSLEPAVVVMRRLVDSGRRGRVTAAVRLTVRLLLASAGPVVVDQMFDDYCASTPPCMWGHDEGVRFLDWLETFPHEEHAHLSDAMKIDRALLHIAAGGDAPVLTLTCDPAELAQAIEAVHKPPSTRGAHSSRPTP